MIDIEDPAHFPSGSACARTRGRIEIKDAIAKIIGVVRCFAARANGVWRFKGDHPRKSDQSFAGPRSEEVGFAHDLGLEGEGFEPLVPLLGSAQLSRHARGGPLPSAALLRIQLSSSMRSAATKPSGWSSMTWCLASGTSTTGARGPIRDDM